MKARTPLPSHRGAARALLPAVLASAVAAGCDDTFEPYQEDEDAVFSMFGYLDLKADTQWVRVMPVPRALFLDPEPIDAVVTLEHPGSGRIVTLNDSVFRFVDPRLDAVAYAHNFWAAERVQPEATYRLRATRSDGASATAVVAMPPDLEIRFLDRDIAWFQVRAERVLVVEVVFGMGRLVGDPPEDTVPAASIAGGGYVTFSTGVPGTHGVAIRGGAPAHPDYLVEDGVAGPVPIRRHRAERRAAPGAPRRNRGRAAAGAGSGRASQRKGHFRADRLLNRTYSALNVADRGALLSPSG